MADARALAAIQKIERALARVEAAAPARGGEAGDGAELQALKDRHQALRGKVERAIAQIDRLIDTAEAR